MTLTSNMPTISPEQIEQAIANARKARAEEVPRLALALLRALNLISAKSAEKLSTSVGTSHSPHAA